MEEANKWGFLVRSGKRLRRLRVIKSLTISELSKMSGVGPATIKWIENGNKWPHEDTLRRLCDALQVEAEQIFYPDDVKEVVRTKEMTLDQAIKVFQRVARWSRSKTHIPVDLIHALTVLPADEVRKALKLPTPDVEVKEPGYYSNLATSQRSKGLAEARKRQKEEREKLHQLNYEKMMWEANKDLILKKPKIID